MQSRSIFSGSVADAGLALQAMKVAASGAPKKDPAASIATLVQSVLLLREALTALPGLAQVLQPAKAELLKAVRPARSAFASFKCLQPSWLQLQDRSEIAAEARHHLRIVPQSQDHVAAV